MKRLLMGVCAMLVVTAVSAQSITVNSEHAENVDFSNYKTFDWADQVDNQLDSGVYFLNDLIFKAQIREAVRNEMMAVGYEFSDQTPDLVVNFRVFDEATTIRSAEDYGSQYWAGANYRDISEKVSYDIEPGTILISLIDRKSGGIVWHGFASGLIKEEQFIKDEGTVIQAVNMIFEEYNRTASGITKK